MIIRPRPHGWQLLYIMRGSIVPAVAPKVLVILLLAIAVAGSLGWARPVVSGLLAYAFFGLDELGEQMEEPFGLEPNDLPLDALVRIVEIDLLDVLGHRPLPEVLQPQGYRLQ